MYRHISLWLHYIYVYIYTNGTESPDFLASSVSVIHYSLKVLLMASSSHTKLIYVNAGRLTLMCSCVRVQRTSFMRSSLFLLQSLELICFTWMLCGMGGEWPHNCCFGGWDIEDLRKTALLCSFHLTLSLYFSRVQMVPLFCHTNMTKIWMKLYCISFFLTSRLHFWNSPPVTIRF